MRSAKCLLVLSFLFVQLAVQATTRRVLFIGNSYTYTNSMPDMLQSLAASAGDTLIFDMSAPGGYTFQQHCSNATTRGLIFSQPWDIVVLQEQSQLPSFPPAEVDTEVYPYAHILDSLVHANNTCTQTMFLMTWGHANGDPGNCAFYPTICTYAGAQGRLRESYMEMTHDNNAVVAPVGAAFKVMMDSFASSVWLYQADSSHPIVTGSYLEACVLYNSIFHKRTKGTSYMAGLPATTVATLQRVADRVTMDSLAQWQQYGHYPYAGFTSSAAGHTATFNSQNPSGGSDYWQFGDGATATSANPSHTYASNGVYLAHHTVTTSCFTEQSTDTVRIGSVRVQQLMADNTLQVNSGVGNISIIDHSASFEYIELYSMDGKLLQNDQLNGRSQWQAEPGLYVYRAYNRTSGAVSCGKVVVY